MVAKLHSREAPEGKAPANNGRAYALLTFTSLCWGGNAVLSRFAVGEISPMALVTFRWLGVLALLAVFARRHIKRDWPTLRENLGFLAAMGALGFTGFNALLYTAAHLTTAINLGIIQGTLPVFVLLGAFLVFRTGTTPLQLIGVTVTLLGAVVVATGGSFERLTSFSLNLGDVMMVAACALFGGYTVGLRSRPDVSAMSMFAVLAGAAFLASLPLLAAEAALGYFQWPTTHGWLVVAATAVFPSLLGQIGYINGVGIIGPKRAGVFVNLVPVFAAGLAVAFLAETFALFHATALALVLGGIWLSETADDRR